MSERGSYIRMTRRLGASPEARERMRKADVEALWYSTCPRCKETVKGDLVELMRHICGGEKGRENGAETQ